MVSRARLWCRLLAKPRRISGAVTIGEIIHEIRGGGSRPGRMSSLQKVGDHNLDWKRIRSAHIYIRL